MECRNNEDTNGQKNILDSIEELSDSSVAKHTSFAMLDNNGISMIDNNELDFQIEQIIEKKEGKWNCKVCGKTFAQKFQTVRHAEKEHIAGVSHVCHVCNNTFHSRHGLQDHITSLHSELVSCDICGKTGMSKKAYWNHKQRNHKILSLNL